MMHIKFLAGVWLVTLVLFQAKAQSINDAVEYLQQKNYVATVETCGFILADAPNNVAVLSMRSLAYTGMGKYEQAMQDADKAVAADNSSGQAHFAKAEAIYYGTKNYNQALQEYEIASESQMAEAYAGKVRSYMALQNYKEALKITDDVIKSFPNNAELCYLRGQLEHQRGKSKAAVEYYDKALAVNAKWNTFQVYLNRGIANEALLEYELAIQDFSKSFAADPNNPVALIARGNIKYLMEQYEEAVVDFKKAEVLSPDNQILTYNIGMAYHRSGDKGAACKYFQKSCTQGNNNSCKMMLLYCNDRKM